MQSIKMEKAENLGAMLRAFALEPLMEDSLSFYYDKTMASRTGDEHSSPLEDLFDDCTTSYSTNAHLLLGHRGCGKSTELNNLKRRFEKYEQPVCIIDSNIETDLFQINHWDIMLLITYGLCKIAEEKNADIPDGTLENVLAYLKQDVDITETKNKSASAEISGGAEVKTPPLINILIELFAYLKSNLKVSVETRTTIRTKMEKRASEWVRYTEEISNYIADKCEGKRPIIIFEGLDKIPDPRKIFDLLSFSALAQMPFPVIYTFPISQFYSSEFAKLSGLYRHHVLPMIKVKNLDKSENNAGIDVIRKIVELRANPQLFESREVLEMMIKQTGGSLRHLFDCIHSAARRAARRDAGKIENEDAERAFSDLKHELTVQISEPDFPDLINVYTNPIYKERISNRDFLLGKMHSSVVLEYRNGERWHDLHPLIAEFLKKQGVINDASN